MGRRITLEAFEEEERINRLNAAIEMHFGDLDPDEVEILERDFEETTTRMIEVVEVRSRGTKMMDLYEEEEFKSVQLPREISGFLRRHDVFMVTLGLKDGGWQMLHMSPSYESIQI